MTNDEIKALALKQSSDNVAFARAIIAAYQAKLLAGVEMPEPDYTDSQLHEPTAYTADKLQAVAAQARMKALEDAKRVCEELPASGEFKRYEQGVYDIATLDCAAAIDKLKEGE